MSIDRDRFDDADAAELAAFSATDRVLGFLETNADRAFEAPEIARRADLDRDAVTTALSRLERRDLVVNKATYWAVTDDDDRLHEHEGYERATALYNDRLGGEDPAAWRAHAAGVGGDNDRDDRDDGADE